MASTKPRAMVPSGGGRGFRNIQEYRWWKNVWQTRSVVCERAFDLDDFNVDEFPQSAYLKGLPGWSDFLKRSGNLCNVTVCTKFLAGLLPLGQETYSFQSYVRATAVNLTPAALQEVMNVAPLEEGEYDFPYEELPADAPTPDQLATLLAGQPMDWPRNHEQNYSLFHKNQLHKDRRVLWLLICNSLMPTTQRNYINLSHARVMEALINGKRFCLVRFFIQQITAGYEANNKKAIKMGMLISELCEEAEVQFLPADERRAPQSTIDQRTVNRMIGHIRPVPEDVAEEVGPDENPIQGNEAEVQDQAGPSSGRRQKRKATTGSVTLDMNAMMAKLEEIQAMNQAHYAALDGSYQQFTQRYHADIGQLNTGLRIMNDHSGALQTRMGLFEDQMGLFHTRMGSMEGGINRLQDDVSSLSGDVTHGFENVDDQLQQVLNHFQPPPQQPPPDY